MAHPTGSETSNGLIIAIGWTPALGSPGVLLDRGSGYVAVEWAGMVLVGLYVSPNSGLTAFKDFLDGVGECVRRYLRRQMYVLEDFNAHPSQWSHPRTDTRGRMLSDWAAGLGLLLVNTGSLSTRVVWRGLPVVDINWRL